MSLPHTSAIVTSFGVLEEAGEGDAVKDAPRITHLIPILEDGGEPDSAMGATNFEVEQVVERIREEGGEQSVHLYPIRWRGESEESVRAQLQPVLLHYRLHILFVQERTKRRLIVNEEMNARVPMVVDYYGTTPMRWRLACFTPQRRHSLTAELEKCLCTPAEATTPGSESRRNRQFQEAFWRLEGGMRSRANSCDSSSIVKVNARTVADHSGQVSYCALPLSPWPATPLGRLSRRPGAREATEDTLYSSDPDLAHE